MGFQWTDRIELGRAITKELSRTEHCRAPDDPGFNIRMRLRVLFSSIDAVCFYLKQWILKDPGDAEFSKRDLEVLHETREKPSEDGSTEFVTSRIGIKRNLLTTIKCLARARGDESPLPKSGDVIPEFETAINIRHRITHPKNSKDFHISDEEARDVAKSIQWFVSLMQWVGKMEDDHLRDIGSEIDESIKRSIDEIKESRPKNDENK